jgi:hypothetical protein
MADNENNEFPEQPKEEEENGKPPSGFDELLYAIADALRAKRSKEAVATLIERYAAEIPVANKRRHQAMLWSYAFTLLVLAAVGVLGWMKVITSETAGTLLERFRINHSLIA